MTNPHKLNPPASQIAQSGDSFLCFHRSHKRGLIRFASSTVAEGFRASPRQIGEEKPTQPRRAYAERNHSHRRIVSIACAIGCAISLW